MSVSSNTVTHFNGNSAISFRALQTTFGGNVNSVQFSTYKRNTNLDETNPIVPDATENANISSSNSNLQLGDFRGSIKQYILTQTSSNTDLDIDAQGWNSNLTKNVIKTFVVNGTMAASNTANTGGSFNAEAYNMKFVVSGNIYGIGGAGGSANSGNGSAGGDALFANNTSNRSGESAKIAIDVSSNGRIWGGGGGGAGGFAGNAGGDLSCFNQQTIQTNVYSGGSTNPGRGCYACPPNSGSMYLYSNGDCFGTGGQRSRCRGRQERGQTCTNSYDRNCVYRENFNVTGGTAGNGGNGGVGEGYNNGQGSGNSGNSGNTTNCAANSNSSTGNSGNSGASGGTWGQSGGNTSNANGGAAGRAIFRINGNTYNVSGANANNIKGSY
jgi:hypothetical protein